MGLMKQDGQIEGLGRPLVVDSCGTMLSGLLGTPAVTSYLESSAGVTEGGVPDLPPSLWPYFFLSVWCFRRWWALFRLLHGSRAHRGGHAHDSGSAEY